MGICGSTQTSTSSSTSKENEEKPSDDVPREKKAVKKNPLMPHLAVPSGKFCAFVWGANDTGQLANGDMNRSGSSGCVWVKKLRNKQAPTLLSVGRNHMCALSIKGEVYAWGSHEKGQCGLRSKASAIKRPMKVLLGPERTCASVSCGAEHSLFLTLDGNVFSVGSNRSGQLGFGNVDSVFEPHLVCGESFQGFVFAIAAGDRHSAALVNVSGMNGRSVFTWGDNSSAQLGRSTTCKEDATNPEAAPGVDVSEWTSVSCGGQSTAIAGTSDGVALFAGQICNGSMQIARFCQIAGLRGKKVVDVALGSAHALALDSNGCVFMWGSGLAVGVDANKEKPNVEKVLGIDGKVVDIAAGSGHSLVVTDLGTMYSWGKGHVGQLGVGKYMTALLRPTLCRPPPSNTTTPALKESGGLPFCAKVWANGDNCAALFVEGQEVESSLQEKLKNIMKDDSALITTVADAKLGEEVAEFEKLMGGTNLDDLVNNNIAVSGNTTLKLVDDTLPPPPPE
eukprot:g5922.t1